MSTRYGDAIPLVSEACHENDAQVMGIFALSGLLNPTPLSVVYPHYSGWKY